ncbi:uncharacterized conserved small protein [Candidatus Methanoperedens nitroreducens]|uniref:Uncharacterized conserved small protein n=1 Tax=Candidatus Methanoperedens nitratireducens TaxID=1392998 RepID=A0A062VA40_9EURY|nr:DUF2283 domain-containing protein [Candidatus Methanoperedens nitroreducens]KCZ72210.1 uncharacterized conserved small protein [Candidatus Methanoperedens nitroreducens]MDJ1421812.1 DUF2283 domain-containing protein [Candidatus Methanoperedens sp.]
MITRYDADSDILYLLIREGEIKDTVEVSEDLFIEYGENDEPVGIELWRARKNVFSELLKYLNKITEVNTGENIPYRKRLQKVMRQ